MKKLMLCLTMLLIAMSLASCSEQVALPEDSDGEVYMLAEITAVKAKEGYIEVTVVESRTASGPYVVLVYDTTEIIDQAQNQISLSDLSRGDRVEIMYDGKVMRSYPPKINAMKIAVKEK